MSLVSYTGLRDMYKMLIIFFLLLSGTAQVLCLYHMYRFSFTSHANALPHAPSTCVRQAHLTTAVLPPLLPSMLTHPATPLLLHTTHTTTVYITVPVTHRFHHV